MAAIGLVLFVLSVVLVNIWQVNYFVYDWKFYLTGGLSLLGIVLMLISIFKLMWTYMP